jgi:hypothetical protein
MTSNISGANGSTAATTSMMTWDIVIGRGDILLMRPKLPPRSFKDRLVRRWVGAQPLGREGARVVSGQRPILQQRALLDVDQLGREKGERRNQRERAADNGRCYRDGKRRQRDAGKEHLFGIAGGQDGAAGKA